MAVGPRLLQRIESRADSDGRVLELALAVGTHHYVWRAQVRLDQDAVSSKWHSLDSLRVLANLDSLDPPVSIGLAPDIEVSIQERTELVDVVVGTPGASSSASEDRRAVAYFARALLERAAREQATRATRM